MADTYTTNLNLTKPEPGAAEDTWGISLNADLDSLDAIFSSSGTQINLNPNQINFADNKKAIFGTGNDLQIYHDGSNSIIQDSGAGNLQLRGASFVIMQSDDGENMVRGQKNAGVRLYYDGATKLDTTSTGIDVTGTVTSDGLTVEAGIAQLQLIDTGVSGSTKLRTANAQTWLEIDPDNVQASSGFATYIDGKRFFNIADTGDISFYDDTGTSQALYWDASAESLGIGTTSPTSPLTVKSSSVSSAASGISIQANGNTNNIISMGEKSTDGGRFHMYDGGVEKIAFYTDGTDNHISAGNIGIGTSNVDAILHTAKTQASGDVPIILENSGTSGVATSSIVFAGNGGSGAEKARIKSAVYGDGYMSFHTNDDTEKMRIDASGRVMVGKTSTGLGNAGVEFDPSGQLKGTAANVVVQYLNRTSSDGSILEFRKDNATVGSIGASGNDLIVGTGDTGLYFYDGADTVIPWNITSNSARNGSIDLGASSHRFKDLYLSGNVKVDAGQGILFGGAAGASGMTSQVLDDYEEGTFTPSYAGQTTNPTVTYISANTEGYYTKIGNIVICNLEVRTSAYSGGSGTLFIEGLPFTVKNNSALTQGAITFYNVVFDSSYQWTPEPQGNTTRLEIRGSRSGNTNVTLQTGSSVENDNPSLIRITVTYVTDA